MTKFLKNCAYSVVMRAHEILRILFRLQGFAEWAQKDFSETNVSLTGQRHVWLPYKPDAPASEHFATHSLAGASGLYSQRFS
jgi:hypothetical protein